MDNFKCREELSLSFSRNGPRRMANESISYLIYHLQRNQVLISPLIGAYSLNRGCTELERPPEKKRKEKKKGGLPQDKEGKK